jgi:anti-sigma B factor antagonist
VILAEGYGRIRAEAEASSPAEAPTKSRDDTMAIDLHAEPRAQLEIGVTDHGTTRMVTLAGEVDISTARSARQALREALHDGMETVVLDLAGVTFLDSTGVHLVADAARTAEERRRHFVVVPGPPHVQAVFAMAGVLEVLPFVRAHGRPSAA